MPVPPITVTGERISVNPPDNNIIDNSKSIPYNITNEVSKFHDYIIAQLFTGTYSITKTRIPAVGNDFTVPNGISWLTLTQTTTVTNQNITFPVAARDGQILVISTLGDINSLNLLPSNNTNILGWTNGSSLPANASIQFGWDAQILSWMRLL